MTDVWLNERLSSLLDFPVPEDLINYILSIKNFRDLEDYLKTLLNFNNPQHQQLFSELLLKQQIKSGSVSKNSDLDSKYFQVKSKTLKSKQRSSQESDAIDVQPQESEKDVQSQNKKKSPRFVNLYSTEGQTRDVIQLKGRHRCDCQASRHQLVNNCLSCGRIVCQQEGSGPCLVCNTLVCSREEQEAISSGTKRSEKLYQKLLDREKPAGWEAALCQRNRLLEYDRTSESRTRVIDDESDYFAPDSVWLSKEERDRVRARQEELHAQKHASRLSRTLTLDFAGRTVLEDPGDDAQFRPEDDPVLREISRGLERPRGHTTGDENVHPGITSHHPVFQGSSGGSRATGRGPGVQKTEEVGLYRVQDRQFLEMSDQGVCLSLHQPLASLLVAGIKVHEGRTWYSPHRGRLWIASASKPPSDQLIQDMTRFYNDRPEGKGLPFPSNYPVGCLLGCVDISHVLPQEEYRKEYPEGESESPYVFICTNAQQLPINFPIQGQHKIYKLDSKIHHAAQKSLQRFAKIQAERTLTM